MGGKRIRGREQVYLHSAQGISKKERYGQEKDLSC